MQQFEITVQLKTEVLDPEGRAIRESLSRLGVESLRDVQVSKRYVVSLENGSEEDATRIAQEYLANPVSETFQVRKL